MSNPFARITSRTLQPESIDLAFDHFRQASAPVVRGQSGSLAILGAGNRKSGFGCSISFWETLDSLERSTANPRAVEAMGGYARWMAGPFKFESYVVVSGSIPEPGPDDLRGTWVRMTMMRGTQESMAALLDINAMRLDGAQASSKSCFSTLSLSSQIGAQVLGVEFWSSQASLLAWDATAKLDDQRLFRSGDVEQPPERDTLEVFGLY